MKKDTPARLAITMHLAVRRSKPVNRFLQLVSIIPLLLVSAQCVKAEPLLFSEDFEGNLSLWVGKNEGAHSGVIVNDPIRLNNHVVSFTSLTGGGDIFGSEVGVIPGVTYRLEFEYLGVSGQGSPGDLGGFIGIAEDTPGAHRWLDGTTLLNGSDSENDSLVDDGSWHSYSLVFDPFDPSHIALLNNGLPLNPSNNTIRLMLEDYLDSGGVAGDVFFDNVRLTAIPEPSSGVLAALGLVGLAAWGWRRKRAS